jgi:hypothetical protein
VLDFGLAKLLESELPSATADGAHAATHSPTVLKRCLEKDRRNRVADISTAAFVLDEATNLAPEPAKAGPHVLPGDEAARGVVGAGFSRLGGRRPVLFSSAAALVGGVIVGATG